MRVPAWLRLVLLAASALGALALPSSPALARDASYPSRAVRIVAPFAAGSGTDYVARIVADELAGQLGGSFVVENRAGASGTIGADAVAKSAADGYTLLFGGTSTHSSAPSLFKSLPYDPERDFVALANVVETSFVLVVRGESPVKSVADLSAWLKAHPREAAFAYGSPTTQVAGAALLKRLDRSATPVPYKSNPQALTDLLGGQVAFMFLDQTSAIPQIQSGKVRALAVAAEQRLAELPDVPTAAQTGLPGFAVQTWVGLLAPAGLPPELAARLREAMARVMAKPTVQSKLAVAGRPVAPTPPEAFAAYLKAQRSAWAEKVRDAGIQPE